MIFLSLSKEMPRIIMTSLSVEIGRERDKKGHEKREKLDLILELLIASSEPIKKTHLIYRTKINHAQLSRYLSLLLKFGMIVELSQPSDGYVVSDKGRLVLQLFSGIVNKPDQDRIKNSRNEVYR
jgi:predicted transcriptional regulator